MIKIILILIIKRSKTDQSFIREVRRNDWVTTICDSISDINNKNTCFSWLIYYLGAKNEDKYVSTTVKLSDPMSTKKVDRITVAAMW